MAQDRPRKDPGDWPTPWLNQMIARPEVQSLAQRLPGLSQVAKRDGAVLFDLIQGFVRSQVLFALVQLDLPQKLFHQPKRADAIAAEIDLEVERTQILLNAGVAIGILQKHPGNRYTVSRHGTALCTVPGLQQMVRHHGAFYRDMGDPVALLRGEAQTELSTFWPYVFGAEGAAETGTAERYSDLMADSQRMVAQDTLRMVDFSGLARLLDVGGGTGAFCIEVAGAHKDMTFQVMDLPAVEGSAQARIARAGLSDRITFRPGSFRDEALPEGFDAISLIRVLYDHEDDTIRALLKACYDALPAGGRLIVSEPMSGGESPDPITDVYFAFYTLAMKTGRARSQKAIAAMLREAGFDRVRTHKPVRSYVTTAISAVKSS